VSGPCCLQGDALTIVQKPTWCLLFSNIFLSYSSGIGAGISATRINVVQCTQIHIMYTTFTDSMARHNFVHRPVQASTCHLDVENPLEILEDG